VSKETYTSVKRDLVDCNASVTVARPAVFHLSQWGSGWPPPGLLGIFSASEVALGEEQAKTT